MSNKISKDIVRRLYILSFISLMVFSILLGRIFYIQVIKGEKYKHAAESQRIRKVRIQPARGIIYDRNLIPLTNRKRIPTIIVFKEIVNDAEETLEYLKDITGQSKDQIKEYMDNSKKIVEIPIKKSEITNLKNKKGILKVNKVLRYEKDNILAHVIGYINKSENKGQSGIELLYDDILAMKDLNIDDDYGTVKVTLDGKNRLIPGFGYKTVTSTDRDITNSVKLTIDYHIQKLVENIMDVEKKNGAVIVAEVETGNIVAMVSRPNIDQDNISAHYNSQMNDCYNKAIQYPYPPGSLFKIVVLLSALEEEKVSLDEEFVCSGYEEVGSTIIKCHTYNTGGHGCINVQEAFYDSCNSVFIKLGKRVGAKKIIETAKKLGFGEKIGIGLEEEKAGRLPKGDELFGPAIGNISIGQGTIEVTPLQITNMMMVIANNGIQKDMRLIEGIVTERGNMVKKYRSNEEKIVIQPKYNNILMEYMEDVIEKGTAKNISLDDIGGGGGKTGSAQAILNGNETIHAWFSGYFPKEKPKYVITVLIEEGISGGKCAAPIFEKIARGITLLGK
ncbi:peptidoglycan D,D-transpeptidase FtsI family protein [Caldisalinibacter kiritimatiensis]|uniref:Cell division protein FtsI n=1 Tax=Caldisalinibacter kiritimatiensis TaxID=1304284 RepID=R1CCV0_9FIRM|nr:penicillin-binding transpeptidase domain-containing protein [Caldisalinibacter kiritimatiensis]EOD00120.1 Cell division protein FtsI [Caldisalinibacter kiritimatiensis]